MFTSARFLSAALCFVVISGCAHGQDLGYWSQAGKAAVAGATIVAVSGNVAVTGPTSHRGNVVVKVFVKSAGETIQTAELRESDGNGSDGFGDSVAISDDTVVVGALSANNSQGKIGNNILD